MADDIKIIYNHIPDVIKVLIDGEADLSRDVANVIRDAAKLRVPVLTGRLKSSIKTTRTGYASHQVSASSIEGGADRSYEDYVEFGTRYMRAQPYMLPAYVEALSVLYPLASFTLGADIERAAVTGGP